MRQRFVGRRGVPSCARMECVRLNSRRGLRALQASSAAVSSSNVKADAKRIKQLEKELARKDRALAETAALLVLKKKAALYFGAEEGDDILNQSER